MTAHIICIINGSWRLSDNNRTPQINSRVGLKQIYIKCKGETKIMKKIFYGILYHHKSIIRLTVTLALATVMLIKISKEFDLIALVLYYAIIVVGSILTALQIDDELHND